MGIDAGGEGRVPVAQLLRDDTHGMAVREHEGRSPVSELVRGDVAESVGLEDAREGLANAPAA